LTISIIIIKIKNRLTNNGKNRQPAIISVWLIIKLLLYLNGSFTRNKFEWLFYSQ